MISRRGQALHTFPSASCLLTLAVSVFRHGHGCLSALLSCFLWPFCSRGSSSSQLNMSCLLHVAGLGVQGQGRGLPGTSFLSRGFGSLALAAGPKSGQPQTATLQSQGFRQALGACVPRGPEPCHEGREGEVRLCLGWR